MALKLGELGDSIYRKSAEIAAAEEVVKALSGEKRALEDKLLQAMQAAGTDIVRGDLATVSISETIRPKIEDWDAFTTFVLRKKACHLFERRIAATAYREMKETLKGKPLPGTSEYTQLRLNVRKV
jgi:hypothetical protein